MTERSAAIKFGLLYSPPDDHLNRMIELFPQVEFVHPVAEGDRTFLREVDAVLAWGLAPSDIESATNLRWVQWVGAGVEEAPLGDLHRRDIVLTNNRGVHAPNIAEHVLALMLAFTRRLPALQRLQEKRHWIHWSEHDLAGPIGELGGSSLLIVGAGQIGSALGSRADAMGMQVTTVGRTSRRSERDLVGIDQLDSVLPAADHVAICLPLTSETNGLFDAERFSHIKPGAFLYNIGRGPIVDTLALVAALNSGHLGGAGLDVSDPEPLPPDHPLWDAPNVILTAHTAGITPKYWDRASEILAENIRRFLAGRPLLNVVDYDLGY